MTTHRSTRIFGRFVSAYGMAGVLVLLCVYFSWATLQEHQPSGASGGTALAKLIHDSIPKPANVLIAAGAGEEDEAFAAAIEERLKSDGYTVVATAVGAPRETAVALRRLNEAGTPVAVVATTPEMAQLPVLGDMARRFPSVGSPAVLTAPAGRWPVFLTRQNLMNVASQIVVVAILSAGMTLVIVTGGIDLSVGSLIALAAVVTALLIRDVGGGVAARPGALVACAAAGVLACAAVGTLSGLVVAVFRVPAFIVTLSVMLVARGLARRLTHGASVYDIPESFTWLGRGAGPLGIPHGVVLMALVYVAAHVLLSRTVVGRYVYAVGGNAEAARLSGVRVGVILVLVYALSGAAAGLGGVVMASELKSGAPTFAPMYELYAIAAVVIGGTSLLGGEGNVLGTLIGTLVIAVINNGMNLTGVESDTQMITLGSMILGAVLLDTVKKRQWRSH